MGQPQGWQPSEYGFPPSPPRRPGYVDRVQTVAVMMIIQGSLESILGILLLVAGPSLLFVGQRDRPAQDESFLYIISGVYAVLGLVMIVGAALKFIAGLFNLKYRHRVFGIVGLISAALSLTTCYCLPTALAVMIYGLIVYMKDDVRRAFEMGDQGATPAQIKAAFR